jgi:hypothetical protein
MVLAIHDQFKATMISKGLYSLRAKCPVNRYNFRFSQNKGLSSFSQIFVTSCATYFDKNKDKTEKNPILQRLK